jgi:putative transposase
MLRVMRENSLLVTPNLRLSAKRTLTRSKPRPTKLNEWWGIAMTQVLVEGFGWVYSVLVLDWYPKKIVGYYAGTPGTARHWLTALDMAVNRQFPQGARDQGVSLMRDNGCQPTAITFMEACRTLGIQQAFTSYNHPKGKADTERVMRTLTEECLWLREWSGPFELVNAIADWLTDYNAPYLHSALGYKSPRQFERDDLNRHSPPFVAA